MGRPKQLLPVNGRPAVRYCAETILAAGIMDVVVVIGPRGGEIEAALEGLPLRIVRNPDPSSDMAGSVRIGLNASDAAGRFVLICLADHPLVAVETMRMVLAEAARNPARIIIPRYQGRRGHPTLFPRSIINEVFREKNLRDIISGHPAHVHHIDLDDEGIVLDMDTERDYAELRRKTGDVP
jgi:CTP:molybdopterin cytidylyltransferase MocA